jgi:uncharacterized protein
MDRKPLRRLWYLIPSSLFLRDMNGISRKSLLAEPSRFPWRWGCIVFALAFPTVITWAYFVLASGYPTSVQQATYVAVKAIQFTFPLIWVFAVLREPVTVGRPKTKGLLIGVAFSVLIVGVGWLVFETVLRDSTMFASVAPLVRRKIAGFGIESLWKYVALASFYSLFHSLLEEYYWRWFVFGQLRQVVRLWPAIFVSAIGFMGHHVVVLLQFFPERPWLAWVLSLAVAVGGIFWAWLYERSGSLLGPWMSHLLIDAGIFWIGYELIHGAF